MPIAEGEAYDPRRHVAWALSLFRMRVRIVQDLRALIVLGGKDDGRSWGRFAGITEEVMIAIALRKPVYVLGGAGGAARATGQLLGLDATTPDLRRCLAPAVQAELAHALKPYAHCFEIPGEPKSPIDLAEILKVPLSPRRHHVGLALERSEPARELPAVCVSCRRRQSPRRSCRRAHR